MSPPGSVVADRLTLRVQCFRVEGQLGALWSAGLSQHCVAPVHVGDTTCIYTHMDLSIIIKCMHAYTPTFSWYNPILACLT